MSAGEHAAQVTVYFGPESGHDIYIAECSCGWRGPQSDWRSEAEDDRQRHQRNQRAAAS